MRERLPARFAHRSSTLAVLAVCGIALQAGSSELPADHEKPETRLDQAALLTASCSGCHAAGGSPGGIVSLDGMSSDALESKLLAYRNDRDGGSAMHRMARGYTEQQIAVIAHSLGD